MPFILFDFERNRVYITRSTKGCSWDKFEKSQWQDSNSVEKASQAHYEC